MRIVMWSGPRNLSTAMMRSFGARADMDVVDEPFYAAFLAASGLDHPMRDEILASMPNDWESVARACAAEPEPGRQRYEKHMTHHMIEGAPLDWMDGAKVAFLIRRPADVAASYAVKREGATAEDLGIERQGELFDLCCERLGAPPPVVEADDVRRAPRETLGKLCAALGLPFDEAMLAWAPGRRETDGIWASHWYGAVERSTGFAPPPAPTDPATLPEALRAIVAEAEPSYQRMAARALRP